MIFLKCRKFNQGNKSRHNEMGQKGKTNTVVSNMELGARKQKANSYYSSFIRSHLWKVKSLCKLTKKGNFKKCVYQ